MGSPTELTWHELHLDLVGRARVAVRSDLASMPVAVCVGDSVGLESPLVRLQSRCMYGEVLGSLDCDCAFQLHAALQAMAADGTGVLIYLEQEGRGAGTLVKARGYALSQREHVDSFDAYHQLGLPSDLREYDDACELLHALGVHKMRLLTNNPEKIAALNNAGFSVERLPLWPEIPQSAAQYVQSKVARGHLK
jgi:GTP cyclohydrolase II